MPVEMVSMPSAAIRSEALASTCRSFTPQLEPSAASVSYSGPP